MNLYFSLLLTLNAMLCSGEDILISVSQTCANNTLSGGGIDIITDATLLPIIFCKDGFNKTIPPHGLGQYFANAYFRGDSKKECLFTKKKNANVYTFRVVIYWSLRGDVLFNNRQEYLITCTYDENGERKSKKHEIKRIHAGKENQKNMGKKATPKIDLDLIDVSGNVVSGALAVGRPVRLQARLSGKRGLKVVSCDALSEKGVRKGVLKGGCGDGSIFKLNEGFITKSNMIQSPYFRTFRVNDGNRLSFKCNFTICSGICEGQSCVTLKKRSTNAVQEGMVPGRMVSVMFDTSIPEDNHSTREISEYSMERLIASNDQHLTYFNVGALFFFLSMIVLISVALSMAFTSNRLK